MKIQKLVIGPLKTNCYLVYKNDECLIIDPGGDSEVIVNNIRDLNLTPTLIAATHGHYDHILAVNELKLTFKIPFLMTKEDEAMLKWFRKSAQHFSGFDPGPPPKIDTYLEKNSLSSFELEMIKTPGHTPGGVCLYSQKNKILFSGDTIFARGAIGRYDFPYAEKETLLKSIAKLSKLPNDVIVYPGHEEETTIGEFKLQFNEVQKLQ